MSLCSTLYVASEMSLCSTLYVARKMSLSLTLYVAREMSLSLTLYDVAKTVSVSLEIQMSVYVCLVCLSVLAAVVNQRGGGGWSARWTDGHRREVSWSSSSSYCTAYLGRIFFFFFFFFFLTV